MNHNNITSSNIRQENELFNKSWIKKNNLLFDEPIGIDKFKNKSISKIDSSPMCVVWLKNIDRLLNLIPKYYDLKNYHFIDIGCGSGISTIYFKKNYNFKTYSGVDFEKKFIEYIEINKKNSSTDNIQFSIEDVTYLKLQDKPYFLFLFNPFGLKTIKFFIKNNFQNLKKNSSIIGYVNDLHINHFTDYDVQIVRDDFYNISFIGF